MLSKYAQHLDFSTEQVRRLCHPLLSKSPITHFDYERFYDDGRHMAFSTTPDMGACAGGEHLLPTRFEMDMFHQVGLRMTFMSHRHVKDKLGLHTKKQLLEYWYSVGGGDAGC